MDTDTKQPSRAEAEKAAREQEAAEKKAAEQNASDIETFWSFHRGQALVHGERGCVVDMDAARAEYEANRAEAEEKD